MDRRCCLSYTHKMSILYQFNMKLHNIKPHPNPPRKRGGNRIFPSSQRGLRGGVKFYVASPSPFRAAAPTGELNANTKNWYYSQTIFVKSNKAV
jgi:hypothetical protein